MKTEFRKKLEQLINCESMENGSNTPDFMLAEFLCDVLEAWDRTVTAREKWYGREEKKVPSYEAPKPPTLAIDPATMAHAPECLCVNCEDAREARRIEKHYRDEPGARPA